MFWLVILSDREIRVYKLIFKRRYTVLIARSSELNS
jgi:hypothetical protein